MRPLHKLLATVQTITVGLVWSMIHPCHNDKQHKYLLEDVTSQHGNSDMHLFLEYLFCFKVMDNVNPFLIKMQSYRDIFTYEYVIVSHPVI